MIQIQTSFLRRLSLLLFAPVLVLGALTIAASPVRAEETGGYPDWNAPCVANNDGTIDGTGYWCTGYQWGYYTHDAQGHINGNVQNSSRGYGYRNCTDYVAWRVKEALGITIPNSWGDAKMWDTNAAGYTIDTTPEIGDIAQSDDGALGHVGYVEDVTYDTNGVATAITVSQYNAAQDGKYTSPTYTSKDSDGLFIRGSGLRWHHFIDLNGTGVGGGVPIAGSPTAVSRSTTSLDVIYRTSTNGLRVAWYDASAGGWHKQDIADVVGSEAALGNPKAITRTPTSMDVFYRDTIGRLVDAWWDPTAGGWHVTPVPGAYGVEGDPAPIARSATSMDVLYRTTGGQIVHARNESGTWTVTPVYGMPVAASNPTVVSRSSTTLDAMYRASDNQLVSMWWGVGLNWSFGTMAGTTGQTAAAGNPMAYSRTSTSIDMLYRTVSGQLVDEWWDASLPGWHTYVIYGTPVLSSDPVVASRASNMLDVLYRDIGNNLVDTSWANGAWSTGSAIDSGVTDNPLPIHRSADYLDVFYKTSGNELRDTWWAQGQGGWHLSSALN